MTATIIFWVVMVAIAVVVFRETVIRMDYNIRGYQKIKGQWVQTMYPQHYCLEMTFLSYAMMCGIVLAGVFFGVVAITDFSGLSEKYSIETVVHLKPSLMKSIIHRKDCKGGVSHG